METEEEPAEETEKELSGERDTWEKVVVWNPNENVLFAGKGQTDVSCAPDRSNKMGTELLIRPSNTESTWERVDRGLVKW